MCLQIEPFDSLLVSLWLGIIQAGKYALRRVLEQAIAFEALRAAQTVVIAAAVELCKLHACPLASNSCNSSGAHCS